MKTKFLLPMIAMIFAIGMSFATENNINDPGTDYILQNGVFEPIGMELNCTRGSDICRVQFEQNGPHYDVYDAADPNSLKNGGSTVIQTWK